MQYNDKRCNNYCNNNININATIGQFSDTSTGFGSMNEMFWVSFYILLTCNRIIMSHKTVVTMHLLLENVKTVSKMSQRNCHIIPAAFYKEIALPLLKSSTFQILLISSFSVR